MRSVDGGKASGAGEGVSAALDALLADAALGGGRRFVAPGPAVGVRPVAWRPGRFVLSSSGSYVHAS